MVSSEFTHDRLFQSLAMQATTKKLVSSFTYIPTRPFSKDVT
jgi:hypothetical protein